MLLHIVLECMAAMHVPFMTFESWSDQGWHASCEKLVSTQAQHQTSGSPCTGTRLVSCTTVLGLVSMN